MKLIDLTKGESGEQSMNLSLAMTCNAMGEEDRISKL